MLRITWFIQNKNDIVVSDIRLSLLVHSQWAWEKKNIIHIHVFVLEDKWSRLSEAYCDHEKSISFTWLQFTHLAKVKCTCNSEDQPCRKLCYAENPSKSTRVCGLLNELYINFTCKLFCWLYELELMSP